MKAAPTLVVMFRPEFEAPILAGTKHHTIRGIRKRPIKPDAMLSLRVWTGRPYCSPQREFMRVPLLATEPIMVRDSGVMLGHGTGDTLWLDAGMPSRRALLERFAHADGFEQWESMRDLFRKMHGIERAPFEGTLIRWKRTLGTRGAPKPTL